VQSEGRAFRDDIAAGSCTSQEVNEKREKDGEHVWNGEDDREKKERHAIRPSNLEKTRE
jgi:hypothetical protein